MHQDVTQKHKYDLQRIIQQTECLAADPGLRFLPFLNKTLEKTSCILVRGLDPPKWAYADTSGVKDVRSISKSPPNAAEEYSMYYNDLGNAFGVS